jgi:hypothetical protein
MCMHMVMVAAGVRGEIIWEKYTAESERVLRRIDVSTQ